MRAGRSFLRRLIDLSTVPKKMHHQVRLNRAFQSDLLWWDTFLEDWNGVSMMTSLHRSPASATLTSDASGGWGLRGIHLRRGVVPNAVARYWGSVHITVKELVPIVVASAIWGKSGEGRLCVVGAIMPL